MTPEPISDERLAGIEKRAAAATAPTDGTRWTFESFASAWDVYSGPLSESSCDVASRIYARADAEFIAHSRADIPDLVTEVVRLRASLTAVDAVCDEIDAAADDLNDGFASVMAKKVTADVRAAAGSGVTP